MVKAVKPLEELARELPPALCSQVRDSVESLLSERELGAGHVLGQNWAGALTDYRDQYTSVELQHLASDWRTADD